MKALASLVGGLALIVTTAFAVDTRYISTAEFKMVADEIAELRLANVEEKIARLEAKGELTHEERQWLAALKTLRRQLLARISKEVKL